MLLVLSQTHAGNATRSTWTFTFIFSIISEFQNHPITKYLYNCIRLLQKQKLAFTLAISTVLDHKDLKLHHEVSQHAVTILFQCSAQCTVDKTTEHTQLGHIEPLLLLPAEKYSAADPD